jgi:23S rRNA (guanosine2251-2'-O)-methyltransferase
MEDRYDKRKEGYAKRRDFSETKYSREFREKVAPSDVIFGVHAVLEAIKAEKTINRIVIQKGIKKEFFEELQQGLKGKDYQLQFAPVEKLDAVTTSNHQGVIAYISPVEYFDAKTLVDELLEHGIKPNILVLDRLTDVRNFGAIARTAECMGVDAIIIPSKGSVTITPDAVKTSAGALNTIKVCKENSVMDTVYYLQQSGLRIVACTEKTMVPLREANLRGGTVIIMGSEDTGISDELLKLADVRAKIQMMGAIESMNVGVATGIVLYEKFRQMNE